MRGLLVLFLMSRPLVCAGELDAGRLQEELGRITKGFDGRVGACVMSGAARVCVRGAERFSLQSVMKLAVGVAVMETVDRGERGVTDEVVVRREDLSLYVQPLAKLVGAAGFRTTVGDLVRRAIIDSDSAATDVLIAKMGGVGAVQRVLAGKGVKGIRIDRDERHLQTEIVGLSWRAEFVDAKALERAIQGVPESVRSAAYAKYQGDARDTATPAGMSTFLLRLGRGELLSAASTKFVLAAMAECKTFPDRLKAGVAPGWALAHKTGTSGSWKGVTAATNDVGILTAPDGGKLAVAVFVGDSRASAEDRAAGMAKISAAAIAAYR